MRSTSGLPIPLPVRDEAEQAHRPGVKRRASSAGVVIIGVTEHRGRGDPLPAHDRGGAPSMTDQAPTIDRPEFLQAVFTVSG
jgi:hypothetical protein